MSLAVRTIGLADKAIWQKLYIQYLEFYEHQSTEKSIELVWQRLIGNPPQIHGLVAELNGEVVGICHFHFQFSTWSDTSVCYLEDLFVDAACRDQGVATALINRVQHDATNAGATDLYWITRSGNLQAQSLYDKVAQRTDFIRYEVKLADSHEC